MNIFSDYPDIINVALIPMIIAVFALGFPLLIQTITRIDDKYNSTKLTEVFKKETITNIFIWSLIVAISSYVIWLLQIQPFVNWGLLIDNSALILLLLSTITLIISTFQIVYLTYIYFVPEKLVNHLIKLHNNTKKKKRKTLYFESISKILFYSIYKADELLARKLADFLVDTFSNIKSNANNNLVIYPQEYYNTIFEANELLCKRDRRTVSMLNDGALFDLFLDTKISIETYRFIWRCLTQATRYDRVDIVFAYWRKAHQLFNLFMPRIYPDYDYSTIPFDLRNHTEVNKREKERNDFLEFHYALGGLLMYQHKYTTIKELMYFTQQKPPKYVLVPKTMQEVVERYMLIDKDEYFNPVYYQQRYWFPDISGVNSDDVIRMWIKRYLAILFLRQYTLHEYYINSQTLTMPKPPQELWELNRWKEELDSLKYFVDEYLENVEILKAFGFEQLSNKKWFSENNKIEPNTIIDNFKKEIEDKFNKIKKEQPIAPNKEKEFREKTTNLLVPIFQKYSNLFQNNNIGESFQRYFIGGKHYILEKNAFAENQDKSYINTDSITAEAVAEEFQYYALNIFILIFPQKYLLSEKDLFPSINNLNINSKDFVIISVGLYLDYFHSLNIDGLEKKGGEWYYNNIEIIETNYQNELVTQSLFILKKEDLPNIIFKEFTDQDYLKKYDLNNIDETFNIYAGLIDLNIPENEQIKTEIESTTTEKDISQKVLACVDINVEIQCKKKTKCVQLKVFSQFDDRGNTNKIGDVKNIWQEDLKI